MLTESFAVPGLFANTDLSPKRLLQVYHDHTTEQDPGTRR
jgi:hypothetical protein